MSELLKLLAPLIERGDAGPVQQQELVAIVQQNLYGDRLTERIVRSLYAVAPFNNPSLVADVMDAAKDVHDECYLLDVADEDADGAANAHDRLALAFMAMNGRPIVAPKQPEAAPEPAEILEPENFPTTDEAHRHMEGDLMAQADLVVDPVSDLLGLTAPAAPVEEEPTPEGDYGQQQIAVWETFDNTDGGSRHVHIPGVPSCLLHGQACKFAQENLTEQETD